MDVLEQALNVIEHVEHAADPPQRVTLALDLNHPVHRAAYAAALAVLGVTGVDLDSVVRPGGADVTGLEAGMRFEHTGDVAGGSADAASAGAGATRSPDAPAAGTPSSASDLGDDAGDEDVRLRGDYEAALTELVADEPRRNAVLSDTFPRVRELLRDGANVEAVAQIQYRRWVEEHLDSSRSR